MAASPALPAEIGRSFVRVVRGMTIGLAAVLLAAATAVAVAILLDLERLLDPIEVPAAAGWLAAAALAGLAFAAARRFRGWWRGLAAMVLVIVVLGGALHAVLLDGLLGSMLASLGDSTFSVQAPGYSVWRFWRVHRGMTPEQVRGLLGDPVAETWLYADPPGVRDPQFVLYGGRVTFPYPGPDPRFQTVHPGTTGRELLRLAGPPSEVFFLYGTGRRSYRRREVVFRRQRVVEKIADYYWNP